jgi:hypothetical protein
MTRSLSATAWLPARANLFRGHPAQPTAHTASVEAGELSLTVMIEEQADRAARRFAFRAARQPERIFSRPSPDQDHGITVSIADQQSNANPILDHHDPQNSSRFLAGAIAQARPGAVLHNPRYREAAGAYRRSDLLGIDAEHTGPSLRQKGVTIRHLPV